MPYPIKLSIKSEALPILAIIASAILGFYFYAHFPAQVVSHWNFQGMPDRYSGKFTGAFAIPMMLAGMYLLFLILPILDPKRDRYQSFEKVYHFFKAAIILLLLGVYIASGLYNLGYNVKINLVVPLLIGILMILIGNYLGKIKNNWFVGIRTPWTLSSENVWNKTHRMGGYMFILFGLIIIVSPFLPAKWGIAAFIAGVILVVFDTIVYSYLIYKKEQKQKQFPI
jgi:uncharacterized membrane protein